MKRLLFLIVIITLLAGNCFGGASGYNLGAVGQPIPSDWFSSGRQVDYGTNALRNMETLVALGVNPGTGSIFYVDSGVTNEGDGSSWNNAVDTLDEGINLCTAGRGDVILVAQGHTETEATSATSLFTLDVAGVTIIGCGNGSYNSVVASGASTGQMMPTLILDAADATVTISAANCKVVGLLFVSDIADVAVGVTVAATADGSTIQGCVFKDNAANLEFTVNISVAALAPDVKILGNKFFTTAAATTSNAILSAANTGLVIQGNTAYGKYATGAILTSGVLTSAIITDNILVNAEAAIAIALNGTTSTGILTRNFLGGEGSTLAAVLTGDDAMTCFENYASDTAGGSGVINPAVNAAD